MYNKKKLNKKEKINLRILGLQKLMNGQILPSLNKYEEVEKAKTFDYIEEIGSNYLNELNEANISYFNRINRLTSKQYFAPKELENYLYKGNINLLKKDVYVMNGLNHVKDYIRLNSFIKAKSKEYVLLFKETDLNASIYVPEGSIIVINDDYINKVSKINKNTSNLYIGGVPYKTSDKSYSTIAYSAIVLEKIHAIGSFVEELFNKVSDKLKFTPLEINEVQYITTNIYIYQDDEIRGIKYQSIYMMMLNVSFKVIASIEGKY